MLRPPVLAEATPGCTVVACGGTACTSARIPSKKVLDGLRTSVRGTPGAVLVGSFGCLGVCDSSAVVVVQRRREHTADPDRSSPIVWIAVGDDSTLADVAAWVAAGGPGTAPMPPTIDNALIALL